MVVVVGEGADVLGGWDEGTVVGADEGTTTEEGTVGCSGCADDFGTTGEEDEKEVGDGHSLAAVTCE